MEGGGSSGGVKGPLLATLFTELYWYAEARKTREDCTLLLFMNPC